MFFYVGVKYTASARGSTAVAVRCEKCFQKYYYHLICTGVGRGEAPYGLGAETAKKRARQAARRHLERLLETEIAPVPCPGCGHYQDNMIPKLREPRLRGLRTFGVYTAVVGGVLSGVATIVTMMYLDKPQNMDIAAVQIFWGLAVIALLVEFGAILWRRYKNSCYDPNDPETEQERRELARRHTITREQAEAIMDQKDD
jgi:hypothetical protein